MSNSLPAHQVQSGNGNRRPVIGRRCLLAGSAGTAILMALQHPASAQSLSAQSQSVDQPVFVFGMPDPQGPLSSPVQAVTRATPAAAVPASAITELAALPVKSPDGTALALVCVAERPTPAVAITLLDTKSTATLVTGTLPLLALPEGALVLVTPAFSADSAVVALVLSITVPSNWQTVLKRDPRTGTSRTFRAATWVSHHELAYFDRRSASFTGPFALADAPSLARVSAVATSSELFLWTVEEAAALRRPAGFKAGPGIRPTTRLSAFALGEGKARFTVPAPGPWPVSGEPIEVLPSGELVRLAYGRITELYSARTGGASETTIPALNLPSAKPGVPTMQVLPDGTVFINSPSIGRAVIADPAHSFTPRSVVRYSPPRWPASAPASKAVLSADGRTVYVLGGARVGGLAAYDVASNKLVGCYSNGTHFTGLYRLASGTLLAVGIANPQLEYYSPSLTPLGTARTDLYVSAVF
jgi:hypothetical protein